MKVSVLLPAFNAAATLSETLQSIRAQTLDDFEVVIINDGSTDLSASILDRQAKMDEELTSMGYEIGKDFLPVG